MDCCVIGAGAQGSATAAVLARIYEMDHVVLADSDLDLANRVAEKLGSGKVRTASVDAIDAGSVAAVAEGSDIILNLVHMEYAAAVRKGALAVGCDYVDSCSDSSFLEDLAFKGVVHDDAEFEAARIAGVTGAGWAPGVANVLCRYAVDQVDEVDELVIRLGIRASASIPPRSRIRGGRTSLRRWPCRTTGSHPSSSPAAGRRSKGRSSTRGR